MLHKLGYALSCISLLLFSIASPFWFYLGYLYPLHFRLESLFLQGALLPVLFSVILLFIGGVMRLISGEIVGSRQYVINSVLVVASGAVVLVLFYLLHTVLSPLFFLLIFLFIVIAYAIIWVWMNLSGGLEK